MSGAAKAFLGILVAGLAIAGGGLLIVALNLVEGAGDDMYDEFLSAAALEIFGIAMLVFIGPLLTLIGLSGFFAAIHSQTTRR